MLLCLNAKHFKIRLFNYKKAKNYTRLVGERM